MATRTLIGLVVLFLLAAASPAVALGEFWAITNEPVTIGGVEVPADMYVPVVYDGGDFWYSSGYKDADHIPKSSVQLLQKIAPNGPSPIGFRENCKVYDVGPKTPRPVHSLMAEEFEALPPHFMNGFRILYKEGGTYIVQYGGPENNDADYWEHTRRIAANCVKLTNGKAYTGYPVNPPFTMESSLIDKPMSMWGAGDYFNQFKTMALVGGGLLVAVYLAGAVAYRASRA